MLALLLFALAAGEAAAPSAAPEPDWRAPIDQAAFCRDLKTMIAAAADTPAPFASITRPGDEQKVQWAPTATLASFGWCQLARHGEVTPSLMCRRHSGDTLAKDRAEAAEAVRACTGVEPLPPPEDFRRRNRETVFETPTWTLVIAEVGCDRCRGMPSLSLSLKGKAAE